MTDLKNRLVCIALLLCGGVSAFAFTSSNAVTIFDSYNNAFLVGGYYSGWWTGAEEIEMAEDAYDNSSTSARQTIVANACSQFISHHTSNWISGSGYNEYNDDISWAVIAMARGYLITGNTTFRDVAKNNWDGMYNRAWDTNFLGGGLWWRQSDKAGKNAAVEGPATVAACYLYSIYGDTSYLSKAQSIYAWERQVLFQTNSGAIYDSIGTNNSYNMWASTYNQGTFIGAANFLYRATGLPFYYQDAILAARYTQNSMTSGGILPEYGSGSDLSGFNGIFARWMARFAKDQNIWPAFGPWLTSNANAAWSVRNTNNLAWQKWATPMGTNAPEDWGCSAAVIVMQIADPSPSDALKTTPSAGFTATSQSSRQPNYTSIVLTLTNTDVASFNWSLGNTSAWLNVSAGSGTLLPASSTNITVNLIPSATTNLPAGRYIANICLTNLTSGVIANRLFTLAISGGSAPIALTGYNAALLAANTATAGTPNATAFDIANNYCFYQAGLNAGTRGLPPDGTFTSLWDATTVFQFLPYGSTNTLCLGSSYPSSVTLTLTTPQIYSSINILASSANGGGLGTLVLNYTNGTHSQALNFNAQDWFGTTSNVAISAIGRLKLGAGFGAEDSGPVNPNLYQTTFNLGALGLNQMIASVTFTKPGGSQTTAILAVSGTISYREPVITQQPTPANLFRFAGATNTWSVAVNAGFPISYNWRLNGTNIPAATNTSYKLANMQTNHSGNYTVVISNSFGAVTSSIAALTVVSAPSYPYGQTVLADGPIGYWRLDESSGPIARDYIANNNGTYTATALPGQTGNKLIDTHTASRFGSLATTNSCVMNVPVDFAAAGNVPFTVEAWVNGGTQTTDAGLVTKGYGGGGEQFNLDCGGGSHAFRFFVRDAAGGVHLATSSVTPNNQWHHLVGVCDQVNSNVFLYVDGVKAAQGAITPNTGLLYSTMPMSIGSRPSGASTSYDNQFVGYMEEVAVYNYALSSNQVVAHFITASNRAPVFVSNPIIRASVNAGQSYADSIATSANDPNGDPVNFAKVSGPAWLTVAAGGALSGTPANANANTNTFVVSARDAGGQSNTATLYIYVNGSPAFTVNPFAMLGITAGQAYAGNIASAASDPNSDTLSFTKISGPAWLSVAGNGALSGTPLSADAGTNAFVVQASDAGGLFNAATMNLTVTPAAPITNSALLQGNNLQLNWAGGIAPYQVQFTTNLTNPNWQNWGAPINVNTLSLPTTNDAAFYRIYGQ